MADYNKTAREARLKVLDLIYKAQSSHIGSNFSCIDLLTVLYDKYDREKDIIIVSKGWVAASVYYFLQREQRITLDDLDSFCQEGSRFIGLTEPMEGIVFGGGSMGMGLPAAVGMALAKKIKKEEGQVYVLMSDGELQCGSYWESTLIMKQHNLNNLTVIIDNNGLCGMGKTKDVLEMNMSPQFDGHNYDEIAKALDSNERILIAKTIKGKGVSFMENDNLWHYKAPNKEEYERAKEELCQT